MLIQTASAATTIDPAYTFGFNAGTHANKTLNSQNYGCIIGYWLSC
jgi:hypothetical protein